MLGELLCLGVALVIVLGVYALQKLGGSAAPGGALPYAADARVGIAYSDARGDRTERFVSVRSFGAEHFYGRCELRRDMRTFRFDRVEAAFDASTGEVIPDLRRHLEALARGRAA